MPTKATTRRRPPPESEQEFELLVVDVARLRLENPSLVRLGRRGQAQNGIDGFDPIAKEGDGVVWQATLKTRGVVSKLKKDLALMDGELRYTPAKFVLALGIERDAAIQLQAVELSVSRLKKGKCAIEIWFWDELYDVVVSNDRLHQKFYPEDARVSRSPTLSMRWQPIVHRRDKRGRAATDLEQEGEDVSPAAAKIEDGFLQLPVSTAGVDDVRRILSAEVAECEQLMGEEKASRFKTDLEKYKVRCERFLSIVVDEASFRDWYVREHWKLHARTLSLGVANDGTAPATDVHVRLEPPPWLRLFFDEHEPEGILFPRRPNFVFDRMSKMNWLNVSAGPQFVMTKKMKVRRLPIPFRGSDARLDGNDVDVTAVSLSHQHRIDLPERFAAIALPVPGGTYSIDYRVFSIEGVEWIQKSIGVHVIADDRRFDYKYPIRDALGLDVTRRKL
jgi:hypothetical protein